MKGRAIPLRPTAVIMSVVVLAVLQAGQWSMPSCWAPRSPSRC
ncbi:hypothetical protein [Actinoplanes awajinensis]|nr:hypothetical protein [Actinoplanes awajinensis]